MAIKYRKNEFLAIEVHDQRLINPNSQLEGIGCTVAHAQQDADVLILTTTVELSSKV